MNINEILDELESLADEKMRAQNIRNGAGDNQYGVRLGKIRKLANGYKKSPELAKPLWETGNIDAQLMAILIMKPKLLTMLDIDRLIRSATFSHVADWLIAYVIKKHQDKEQLRIQWMVSSDAMSARAGWSLTADKIIKDHQGLNLAQLLDRIEMEMPEADPEVQWTMNFALCHIGIYHSVHRQRALAIGEKLGIYRDYPVSKGCTSPFAPIWINEMVSLQQ